MTDVQRDLRYTKNEEFVLEWNKFAKAAKDLTDEDLLQRIKNLKTFIANTKVELEATNAELETRDDLKRKIQFDADITYKPLPNFDAERTKDVKHGKKLKTALEKLVAMGIPEGKAKNMIAQGLALGAKKEETK